jgi:hypothetical protein
VTPARPTFELHRGLIVGCVAGQTRNSPGRAVPFPALGGPGAPTKAGRRGPRVPETARSVLCRALDAPGGMAAPAFPSTPYAEPRYAAGAMKKRREPDALSQRDLEQVEELQSEIELSCLEGNDAYRIDLLDSRATSRVWWEVCRRMALAGLVVAFRGQEATIGRPPVTAHDQPRTKRAGLWLVPLHRP